MKAEVVEYIHYRLVRSAQALWAARLMLESGLLFDAVNRLYYACFYAVSALLLTEGFSSAKHSGVRSLFVEHWIRPKRLSEDLGRFYQRLFEHRQRADYRDLTTFRQEEIEGWLKEGAAFVEEVKAHVVSALGAD